MLAPVRIRAQAAPSGASGASRVLAPVRIRTQTGPSEARGASRASHLLAAAVAVLLSAAALASAQAPAQELVLKDGRKIQVTRLVRRDGQVVFQTTRGETFSVPEGDVVSPPLASIPAAELPPGTQLLVLKDGRRIPVRRLARRDGQVRFETTRGETFSVPEGDVVSPPLASIEVLKPTPPPTPEPTPTPKPIFSEGEMVPLPNRWSIDYPPDPRFAKGRVLDPYNQNTLKGDKPIVGSILFVFTGAADVISEARRGPVPGGVSTADPATFEFFGRGNQLFAAPRLFLSAELFQGQTSFRPKKWALKVTTGINYNYVRFQERNAVNVDVREGSTRTRHHVSLEEAFVEIQPLTLSSYYDTVSIRAGVQPFNSDFRGLIFSDFNLGARLFGNLASNRIQYNAAYFDLLEKETNSELNIADGIWEKEERRGQKVMVANVFRQDTFVPGYTVSASFHRSEDEGDTHYDENGFLVRPAAVGLPNVHKIESNYVGLAGDGHLGRLNLSHAAYYAFGDDERNVVSAEPLEIQAFLGALEASYDKDWARLKASFLFASGDGDVQDEKAKGFDTIYDNSNFAGGSFSWWSRSAIPLTQTKVLLKPPLSLLPTLRSNKFEGQGSFVNPGLMLAGLGLDIEVTPKLKAVLVGNYLRFHKTESLEALLFQPRIDKSVGFDLGAGFLYRPLLNENFVVTAGLTGFVPGSGFDAIFESAPCGAPDCGAPGRKLYNAFLNLRLVY